MRIIPLLLTLIFIAGRAVAGEADLTAIESRLLEISETVSGLLFYAGCVASVVGLLLGLYLWRLVMLARNQRDL